MDLNLQKMTVADKLKTMELLWDNICRETADYRSPDWHEVILKNREEQIQQDKDDFQDWDQAKKEIWKSIS